MGQKPKNAIRRLTDKKNWYTSKGNLWSDTRISIKEKFPKFYPPLGAHSFLYVWPIEVVFQIQRKTIPTLEIYLPLKNSCQNLQAYLFTLNCVHMAIL